LLLLVLLSLSSSPLSSYLIITIIIMLPLLLQTTQGFYCSEAAPWFGFAGVSSALVFANLGAAYGTLKSGVGITSMGTVNSDAVMKNIIPVVMAGVLGIYGLIIAVILTQEVKSSNYSAFDGYAHLAAGLSCGLSGMGAGFAIGIVGDAGVRANGIQPKMFVPMVLILIFAEALGLYGLIIGIIMSQQAQPCTPPISPDASSSVPGQYGTHDGGTY